MNYTKYLKHIFPPLKLAKTFTWFMFLLGGLVLPKVSNAQFDGTLYNMRTIPQFNYLNPSANTNYRFYIGLPALSSIYAGVHNNGFVINDLIKKRADDSVYFDLNEAIDAMGDANLLGLNLAIDWLSFGFKKDKNLFFFNMTEKMTFRMRYPKDLFVLAWEGNAGFIDKTADLSKSALRLTEYQEYGLGMAREINETLIIGAKIKLLSGLINTSTTVSKLNLYTAPSTYELTGNSDIVIKTSVPPDEINRISQIFSFENLGLALDLGATYKLNDKFSFSGSIVDLGYIHWKRNPITYSNDIDNVTFKGNALNTFTDSNSTEPFETVFDSMRFSFENAEESYNSYKDGLSPRIYLGGNYVLNEANQVGLLFHGEYFKKSFYPTLTASYNYVLKKWIGASASYSIMNGSYFNLGLGLSINLGAFQIYAVSDNFSSLFNLAKINGAVVPYKANTLHLHMGINLTFQEKEADKDEDGIIDKKDDCPDIAGPKEFNGCPDRDGDKIVDNLDDCPDDPGLAEFNGCPDRDEDKIIDKEDDCPDLPGDIENKGCPAKLHLLDDASNHVLTTLLNEEGFFVYEALPVKNKYVFKLEVANAQLIPEVHVLQSTDDNVITALRDEAGLYIYEVQNKKEITLYLINPMGDTLMMATKNDEGYFVFEPLPADQRHLFLLDGNETDLLDELLILLIGDDGNERVITASRDATNMLRYEYIPPIDNSDLDLLEEVDVPIILMEEEKEIINTAVNHLEFNFGSAVISFGSYSYLDELSNLLNNNPEWRIKLSGHTDNVGSESLNLLLSKKRAEAIREVLINRSVSSDRIIVKYYGETQPITGNDTEEGRQRNRRVDMLMIEKEDSPNQSNTGIAFEGETGIWFKVQVMASANKVPINDTNFKGVKDVHEYVGNGLFKYTVGKSNNFDQIYNVILKALKEKGFKEAFIVAFKDGKRIPVADALKLLND
ncbi:MAG TPA: OmpA family protein [Flavobacteriales bacterium]|nr:OmpA family protein [Flavobacteriales bacterium]